MSEQPWGDNDQPRVPSPVGADVSDAQKDRARYASLMEQEAGASRLEDCTLLDATTFRDGDLRVDAILFERRLGKVSDLGVMIERRFAVGSNGQLRTAGVADTRFEEATDAD